MTDSSPEVLEYDLIVIGGGSAGLSCSKASAAYGAKVALIDAVEPTLLGTTWGIGGTCANVGCIPKKLMHQAALVGHEIDNGEAYGWLKASKGSHDWSTLSQVVNDRVKGNNFVYRVDLNKRGVKYYKAFGSFIDEKHVRIVSADKKKTENVLKSDKIVVCTGLRPKYPDVPGAHYGITSDDLFTLPHPPGKTLVVGGGYVALECAGFLAGLGYQVEVAIRSMALRGFDRDCVARVVDSLSAKKIVIRMGEEVDKVVLNKGKKDVTFTSTKETEQFDTIIWAIGRQPAWGNLFINKSNVELSKETGRIVVNDRDETTTRGIYALGDIAHGRPELTPTAIRAGQALAARLFNNSTEQVDYRFIPTTVFTPLEFSTCGLSEEAAVKQYGEDNLEIFHSYFTPFEYVVPQTKDKEYCYVKSVCERSGAQKVLGLHFVGPNAAEVMQGFGVAMSLGMTMNQLRTSIAIHPCSAEQFVMLNVTKRSNGDPKPQGCCG